MLPRFASWVLFALCVPMVVAQTPTWGKRPSSPQPMGGHDLGIAYDSDPAPPLQLRGIDEAGVSNRRPELRGVRFRAPLDSGDHEW